MCVGKKPKIEKADAVEAPPPMVAAPAAPVLNDTSRKANSESASAATARKGRSALTIPLIDTRARTGVNIPR